VPEDYNTHLLKSIQKMAAGKSGKTSRTNLKDAVRSSHNRSRKSGVENPIDQLDLQNILKATMNGEDSCGDLHSQFGGILEASQSSLNMKDLLPNFNEQAKLLTNALNISNIAGASDSHPREPLNDASGRYNVTSFRGGADNVSNCHSNHTSNQNLLNSNFNHSRAKILDTDQTPTQQQQRNYNEYA
jgi:hypothetical protein